MRVNINLTEQCPYCNSEIEVSNINGLLFCYWIHCTNEKCIFNDRGMMFENTDLSELRIKWTQFCTTKQLEMPFA